MGKTVNNPARRHPKHFGQTVGRPWTGDFCYICGYPAEWHFEETKNGWVCSKREAHDDQCNVYIPHHKFVSQGSQLELFKLI